MSLIDQQIKNSKSLDELFSIINRYEDDYINAIQNGQYIKKLDEITDLSSLPTFGDEPDCTFEIFSWDNNDRVLIHSDIGWSIQNLEKDFKNIPKKTFTCNEIDLTVTFHTNESEVCIQTSSLFLSIPIKNIVLETSTKISHKSSNDDDDTMNYYIETRGLKTWLSQKIPYIFYCDLLEFLEEELDIFYEDQKKMQRMVR